MSKRAQLTRVEDDEATMIAEAERLFRQLRGAGMTEREAASLLGHGIKHLQHSYQTLGGTTDDRVQEGAGAHL